MRKIVKQVAGIDVAAKELVVTLGRMYDDWTPEIYASKSFANNQKGFLSLVLWVKKLTGAVEAVRYVMEATGVYHEALAYFLEAQGHPLTIVLPSKISNYFKTLDVKSVTDTTAAEAIARFGLERKLDNWKKPNAVFKKLRQLTRERDQVVEARTVAKNQLHAEAAEAEPGPNTVARLKKQIAFFTKQEKEIKEEIRALVKADPQVSQAVDIMSTLPGVGSLTAAIVLAETNGFELVRNKRQLSSYAGLDVKEKQSGTSVKGKPRISKKGNKQLRKAMHLPALAAIRHAPRFKAVYARLVARHGIKMKAAVAVQRKLLEIMYVMYKTKTPYQKEYVPKIAEENQAAA
ncbi:IS110 family transposase [Flavisolibacter tropicus]|uniref:Transposase n=1 Tax=Flavisolibacter tropicus TaxID=1492898 RepID=A0A172U232_9BACT|nr:IS110 family transposase [Flavisolibacter tropicus]ANE53184.1 transposase [Flavisolibacter tropicus]